MMDEIQFEVGEKYENMKGVFEVIAIHRDAMDIRWESGEEISTPIELQQRIIERMQHEKEMEEAKALQKAKKAKSSSKAGKQFVGLEEGDFGTTVSKTSWRGRGQLGGAVAQKFKNRQFKFNSWAVLRKPEVNWLDVKRQKQKDLPLQAKFFARVDEKRFSFGIHLPATNPEADAQGDWPKLLAWLEKPENDSWMKKQCGSHALCLTDAGNKGFLGDLEAREDQWVHLLPDDSEAVVDSLPAFLSEAAANGPLDLRIETRLEKASAVEKKQGIADEMAVLFESMMPLYAAGAA
jgi:hypothetical protein